MLVTHCLAMEKGGYADKASYQLDFGNEESQKKLCEHILQGEEASTKLYHNGKELKIASNEILDYVDTFYTNLNQYKAFGEGVNSGDDVAQGIGGKGRSLTSVLESLDDSVIKSGIQPASGGYMGYIPGGGIPLSALADLVAAATNKYTGHYTACPGGVDLENQVLEWAASLYGFDKTKYGGNLCSGASVGITMCIAAARDKYNIKGCEFENSVLYTSEQAHFCIDKAYKLVGMRESPLRKISVDANFCMDTSVLEETIKDDISKGLRPFFISGSLGTTPTGSVDNIKELLVLAKRYDCWLHIDAAYGGFFVLLNEMKGFFEGIENVDSLCVDPHKSLFLPYGSGIVLVKNREDLVRTFSYSSVLIDTSRGNDQSSGELSPELTRNFRALRLWFPLLYHGVDLFREALREKVMLTRYAYGRMKKMDFIDVGPSPALSLFIFRFNGRGIYDSSKPDDVKRLNKLNKEIRQDFQDDGRVFLTSTELDGIYWLRVVILCIRTHKKEIDTLLDMVQNNFTRRERCTQ